MIPICKGEGPACPVHDQNGLVIFVRDITTSSLTNGYYFRRISPRVTFN